MQPKASIIVPIYNAEQTLGQCLSSIAAQTLQDIEVICINDGSKDGSLAIMQGYAADDPRFVVIDKPNGGYGQGMNRGIAESTGEYIGIVEPDDFIDNGMYRYLYDAAISYDPRAQVVKSCYWRVVDSGTPQERTHYSVQKGRVHPPHQPFRITECPFLLYRHPSIWSCIYERSFLEENHIAFREVPGAGWVDNPFFIETLCQAERIVYVDEAFYHYREEAEGSSSNLKDWHMPFDRWNEMMDILERMGCKDPAVLDSMCRRGFVYASGVEDAFGADNPDIQAAKKNMFSRMDREIVLASAQLSNAQKAAYLALVDPGANAGSQLRLGSQLPYYSNLIREFSYTIRDNGLGYALKRTGRFFGKR